jgi:hypothetical protein
MRPDVRQRYADVFDEAPDDVALVRLVADLDALYSSAPVPAKLTHAAPNRQSIPASAIPRHAPPLSRRASLAHLSRRQGYPFVATLLLAAMLVLVMTTIFPFHVQNNAGHPAPVPTNTNAPAPSNTPIPTPTMTPIPTSPATRTPTPSTATMTTLRGLPNTPHP